MKTADKTIEFAGISEPRDMIQVSNTERFSSVWYYLWKHLPTDALLFFSTTQMTWFLVLQTTPSGTS